MNKWFLHIILLLTPVVLLAQKKDKQASSTREKWIQLREENGYKQSETYKGPESDYYQSPSSINESSSSPGYGSSNGTTKPYQGTPYTPKDLEDGKSHNDGDGGTGSIKEDPNIEPSEPVDVPDFDTPKGPNVDGPNISSGFWKILGIILLVVALAILIYYLIKNHNPQVKTIPFEALAEDLNPAEIPKTELELRLEEATVQGNYKECVRIYFLFAMKELIRRRWIFWKKEKTNMHYIIEVQGRPIARNFEQIVSIYDLVWYGDYTIDAQSYQEIEPQLKNAFQTIENA